MRSDSGDGQPGERRAGTEDDKKPDHVPTERLEEALEQLESLGNANQALLKTLSYDLRTPLNTIIGFADMMEQEILAPSTNPNTGIMRPTSTRPVAPCSQSSN